MFYNNPLLCHVAVEPCSELAPWCRQLVRRKRAVDVWLETKQCKDEVRDFEVALPEYWENWKRLDPTTFARQAVPFLDVALDSQKPNRDEMLLWLDPTVVIGESGKWNGAHLDERVRVETLKNCEKQIASYLETKEWSDFVGPPRISDPRPQALHIKPLGLYLAHEGKNRVALYQHVKLPMPTEVSSHDYFAPERLTLYETSDGWEVQLDQDMMRPIAYCADIIVPMLKAYGVSVVSTVKRPSTFRRLLNRFRS